jgi:(1->4)-alpha-D-glucan 1-alpha-D-glucosylmutase
VREFVARILEPGAKNKFVPSFIPVAEQIARLGAINSLGQVLLKMTTPGVPDIYQGNEIWDLSLVDPDNRRPVDYDKRREMLNGLTNADPADLLARWPDGRIKMFLTQRLLGFRNAHAELFRRGEYVPLTIRGPLADCCVAYARQHEGASVVVVAPRLSSRVGFPPIGDKWQDTVVDFRIDNARDVFTGREISSRDGQLAMADALGVLPFAAMTNLASVTL